MIIYRPTDKVTVKIGEVEVLISPLPSDRRIEILSGLPKGNPEVQDSAWVASQLKVSQEILKYCVKGIKADGFSFPDGSPITLQLDENGNLTSEGLTTLLAVVDNPKIVLIASNLLAKGIGDWGIEGVEVSGVADNQKKSQ